MSNFEDKIITPSTYVTADEHHKNILENVRDSKGLLRYAVLSTWDELLS